MVRGGRIRPRTRRGVPRPPPLEFYEKPDFWVSSPAMVAVKFGLSLLLLAFGYAWAELALGDRWSWVIALGKTSLLVYFVHVALVYGRLLEYWRQHLNGFQTILMTLFVIALMVALAEYRLRRLARGSHKS